MANFVSMVKVASIQLRPSADEGKALMETLREANEACNRISETAFQTGVFGQFALHHEVYKQIRATTRLCSQMTIRCIAKVADSYKAGKRKKDKRTGAPKDKETPEDQQKPQKELRTFKSKGAIPYDSRILSCHVSEKRVSIWTVQGRQQIPFSMGPLQEELLGYPMGESDLVFRKGKWYLNISCKIPDVAVKEASDVLGVDLGIRNIAATSEGELFSGDDTIRVAGRYQTRRKRLQQVGTRSAKRRLKKLARKERNHKKDVNHRISKKLVTDAERSGRAIAMENLRGIGGRIRVRKKQRAMFSKWSFDELKQFVQYKAEARGVRVILVDPRYTSQCCSQCLYVARENRKSQSEFECCQCHYTAHADINAALVIKLLGWCQLAYGGEIRLVKSQLQVLALQARVS